MKKKGTCVEDCEESIRELNSINATGYITQEGGNNICNWALEGVSITETGLDVVMESHPGVCDVEHRVLAVDVCCNMRCTCEIHLKENNQAVVDLSPHLPFKPVYYSCARSEFEECESDCRQAARDYLDNDERLTDTSLNYVNVFENDEMADRLCEVVQAPVFHPGYDSKLVISTRPGELALYKEILLGVICCERPCVCRFEDTTTGQRVLDLSDRLIQKVLLNVLSFQKRRLVINSKKQH